MCVIVLGVVFAVAMVKLQQFVTSKADEVHHRSRVAIQQVCQHRLLQSSLYSRHIICQHCMTTDKKYLTNSHILFKYFKLLFLQLRLVKISCEVIIIGVNYERRVFL